MRVHDVHVRHGHAKTGLLGFALTKVLEQRHIIKEYPDFCKISGHIQRGVVYQLQQPQLFTIWVALWMRSAEIYSSAIRQGFKRWIKMKMREKNEHLITKAADVLTFASQRMSEFPGWEWLRVAIWSKMLGNLVLCLSLVGCRFQLETVWRLPLWHSRVQTFQSFEGGFSGPQGPTDLNSYIVLICFDCRTCQSQIWNCFRASIPRANQSSFGTRWSCHEDWLLWITLHSNQFFKGSKGGKL